MAVQFINLTVGKKFSVKEFSGLHLLSPITGEV